MIKICKLISFTFFLSIVLTSALGQYNINTNSFSSKDDPVFELRLQQNPVQQNLKTSGVPCNPNTFWGMSSTINEYTLVGNTVSFNSSVCLPYYGSLAYCNNLDNGAFSPTFYDALDSTAAYYNGTGWTIGVTASDRLFNCGGNGNFLYYELVPVGTGFPKVIAQYDGTSINVVYTLPDTNQFISVADLNVDDAGNIWFFTGYPVFPYVTDTLNVVSPSGQLLKQFPFNYNTANAYGSFLLNGVLYIGLGSGNSLHPNTLIPVTITNTTATAGIPIPMPAGINFSDLASCNAGTPLSIVENSNSKDFNLFPNPANDILIIQSADCINNEYAIFDLKGTLKMKSLSSTITTHLNITSLPAGIYFIECKNSTGISRNKFVKL